MLPAECRVGFVRNDGSAAWCQKYDRNSCSLSTDSVIIFFPRTCGTHDLRRPHTNRCRSSNPPSLPIVSLQIVSSLLLGQKQADGSDQVRLQVCTHTTWRIVQNLVMTSAAHPFSDDEAKDLLQAATDSKTGKIYFDDVVELLGRDRSIGLSRVVEPMFG
jgi:hypothetical protein